MSRYPDEAGAWWTECQGNGAASQVPAARLEIDPNPSTAPGYYEWVRFGIYVRDPQGVEHMLADGGFTNWTQQLLSDRRERLLISGIAGLDVGDWLALGCEVGQCGD